jgi:dephospho-CoA kinase
MLKVGLTGGLASGKSLVGEALVSSGCFLIQADELGHEALAPGGEAYDAVVREFGREILTGGGAIDRQQLGALVFASPERLARLNALVHPGVVRREEELIAEFAAREPRGIDSIASSWCGAPNSSRWSAHCGAAARKRATCARASAGKCRSHRNGSLPISS